MQERKEIMIVGIDPGQQGGIAYLDLTGKVRKTLPMPLRIGGEYVDTKKLFEEFKESSKYFDLRFGIELCQYTPTLKGKGCFTFGRCVQAVDDVVLILGFQANWHTPPNWKKSFSLIGKTKEDSIFRALQLFPNIEEAISFKKRNGSKGYRDGIAEACLIAEYHRRINFGGTIK